MRTLDEIVAIHMYMDFLKRQCYGLRLWLSSNGLAYHVQDAEFIPTSRKEGRIEEKKEERN